jgi:hypothetical protein
MPLTLTNHDLREAYGNYLAAYALTASGGSVDYNDGTGGNDEPGKQYDTDPQMAVDFARALGAHDAVTKNLPLPFEKFALEVMNGLALVPDDNEEAA